MKKRTVAALVLASALAMCSTVSLAEEDGKAVSLPGVDGPCSCETSEEPDCWESGAGGFDFSKVPPVRIWPRPGNFPVLPTGPGYYSLLDQLTGNCREKAPTYGYPPFALMQFSMFDADFRYLDKPDSGSPDFLDSLHRVRVGEDWLFATGGSAWWRYMNEVNSRLSGQNNDYNLFRFRPYGDLWYKDRLRLFVEFIYADSVGADLPPAPTDVNRNDLLNAFVDVKVADIEGSPAYVRIGRQELLFGSQRLISPLDWSNVRRTFQGVRAFRQGEKFDVDLFWVQPVPADPNQFDSVDNNQNFAGLWTTYRPRKGHFLDAYYLFLDNTSDRTQQGLNVAPFNVHTLGARYAGDRDNRLLYDAEGMLQLGEAGDESILAGAASVGAGYHEDRLPFNPTFWVYYDFASGDANPGEGPAGTFNQLFPFGHYYLGWLDLVGRQNIHDVNAHLFLFPAKWITCWFQYHHFQLAQSRDALYNAGGVAIRRDPTGRAGSHVGNEFDFVLNLHLSKRTDFLLGYSKLFAGKFLEDTGPGGSAELFYMMYNIRW